MSKMMGVIEEQERTKRDDNTERMVRERNERKGGETKVQKRPRICPSA